MKITKQKLKRIINLLFDFGKLLDKELFNKYQEELLFVANTKLGRRFFQLRKICDKDKKIIKFTPSSFAIEIGYRENEKTGTLDRICEEKFLTAPKFSKRLNILFSWLPAFYKQEEINGDFILVPKFGLSVYPFYPTAGAIDGNSYKTSSGATWANIRNVIGSGATATPATAELVYLLEHGSVSGYYRQMYRGLLMFDTSSLDDSTAIDSASLSLWGTAKSNAITTEDLCIVSYSGAETSSIDYQTYYYSQYGTTVMASIAYADFSTTGYNVMALNAGGISNISKTGITRFGARLNCDRANSAPAWQGGLVNSYYIRFSGYAGTDSDPLLTVTYIDPTAIKSINGLTKSSVKSKNGLAIGSIKSINGLT